MMKVIFAILIFFKFLFAGNVTTTETNYTKSDINRNIVKLSKIKNDLENIKIKQAVIEKGTSDYQENLKNRINDLSWNINLYGILITVFTILYTVIHYIISKKEFDELYDKIKSKFNKKYKVIKRNHKKSSELHIKIDDIYGDMLIKKALYHSSIHEIDEALNLYDKIIEEYKNHKQFQIKAIKATINAMELSLIKDNSIKSEYKNFDNFKTIDDKDLAVYEMLLIIENEVKKDEDKKNSFDDWRSKYGKYSKQMTWRFDELNNWAKQIEDENKEIGKLIDKFEPYFNSDLPI